MGLKYRQQRKLKERGASPFGLINWTWSLTGAARNALNSFLLFFSEKSRGPWKYRNEIGKITNKFCLWWSRVLSIYDGFLVLKIWCRPPNALVFQSSTKLWKDVSEKIPNYTRFGIKMPTSKNWTFYSILLLF